MQKLILLSCIFLSDRIINAQLTCTILQSDTTICRGSSILLSIDTTQLAGTVCASNSLPPTLQNGLVAFYPFCGNSNDESGNGNHGTVMGAVLTTDRFGIPNRAYSFNGSEFIIGPASSFPTGTRSISVWFYATNIGAMVEGPTLLGYGGQSCGQSWFETINNPGTPTGQQNTYQVQGHCNNESVMYYYGNTHPNNAWHHWVITTSPGGTKFYVDGVMVHSDTTFINETYVQDKNFIWGGPVSQDGLNFYTDNNIIGLTGKLDDILIYNRELTQAEIALLYQSRIISWSTGATAPTITVLPLQTTTYYVTVTDSITTCTDSVLVTVSAVDTSLAVLDPFTICSNDDSVRLRAGIAATYQWLRNGTPIAGASMQNYTALQSGTYRVLVTNSLGCSDTSRAVDVNIYPLPDPGFTINAATQCMNGNNFIFTNTSAISSGTMTFNWSFGDGATATTTNANHIYSSPGVYTVKLVAISNNSCTDSISQNLTVNPTVTSTTNITVCQNQLPYTWNSNIYNAAGTYQVTMMSTAGCDSIATLNLMVNISLSPTVTINANPGGPTCSGTLITFTAVATNTGAGIITYTFKVNGSNVQVGTSNSYTTTTLANGNTVTCEISISGGTCLTSAIATSNTIMIPVTATVIPSVGVASSTTSICAGTNITFTATPTNGGSSATYQWQVNGVNVGTNSPIYTTTSLVNGDIVRVIMTSNAACTNPNMVTSNSITMVVNAPVVPLVSIAASPTTICPGTSVTFTATPINGGNSPAFQWKLNGLDVGTNIFRYVTNSLTNGDLVSCSLLSNAACVTSNQANSNNIVIVIDPQQCPNGFFIPTAFTPNNDGKNDLFKPLLFGNVVYFKFSIYNRWGQKIFETADLQKGWDGKVSSIDPGTTIFTWLCTYQFSGLAIENKKGIVILIR